MKRHTAVLWTLLMIAVSNAYAQPANRLDRSTPEAQGVASGAISEFLDSIRTSHHEFHSLMILRHGKVIAEGWWNPYSSQLPHTLYSLSKSFTATAVGFAKSEGKLSLSDKVVSFFPLETPDSATAFLRELTIKDLLTMSVGQEPDPTGLVVHDTAWVRRFFRIPIVYTPGSRFLYNSAATYMLSAIVQKVTGEKVLDYLQPRLFAPLGIARPDWEESPQHINTGGWGLRLRTEDIARFAQLFLQKGMWQGKQVLPAGWVEEASAAHIIQHPDFSQAKRDSSDWEQGYGYQMWRCRHNAYRGDGAFGQYAIVIPEQDVVIAITSETPDMQGELDLIWKILLPAMKPGPLPSDPKAHKHLQDQLAALSLPAKKETVSSPLKSATRYEMDSNPLHIQSLVLTPGRNSMNMQLQTDSTSYSFLLGANDWQPGHTRMKGPYLVSGAINNLEGLPDFKVASEYTWLDPNTLELVVRYIESPHTETFTWRFDQQRVSIDVKQSFRGNSPAAITRLTGVKR